MSKIVTIKLTYITYMYECMYVCMRMCVCAYTLYSTLKQLYS